MKSRTSLSKFQLLNAVRSLKIVHQLFGKLVFPQSLIL